MWFVCMFTPVGSGALLDKAHSETHLASILVQNWNSVAEFCAPENSQLHAETVEIQRGLVEHIHGCWNLRKFGWFWSHLSPQSLESPKKAFESAQILAEICARENIDVRFETIETALGLVQHIHGCWNLSKFGAFRSFLVAFWLGSYSKMPGFVDLNLPVYVSPVGLWLERKPLKTTEL